MKARIETQNVPTHPVSLGTKLASRTGNLPIRRKGRKWLVDYRGIPPAFWPDGKTAHGTGKVSRKLFPTRAEAEGAAEIAAADLEASKAIGFELSPAMRGAAIEAFRLLEGYDPRDLVEAAREYIERHQPGAGKRTVQELVEEILTAHAGAGNREITLRGLRQHYQRFAEDFGERDCSTVETVEIERWLDAKKIRGEHRKNYRRHLRHFFRFACDRHYARRNPAMGIPKVKAARRMPGILNANELQALLNAASAYAGGLMLPYAALCGLAGLRPSEARRLDWAAIGFDKREIYLSPEVVGKTYADRFVSMQPNLIEWLSTIPASARKGPIHWTRRLYKGTLKQAGKDLAAKVKATKDILRHSYASHLYATTNSADLVTANCGHSARVFLRHYKHTVSPDEGRAYFDVRPGQGAARVLNLDENTKEKRA